MANMWLDCCPIEVIPAVDVLGSETVRLKQGDYESVVRRGGGPADAARRLAADGAQRIHLVDLDGARSGVVRPALVGEVARAAGVPVQASGGIRSLADARRLLDEGADRVVVGTAAWPDPSPWLVLGDALVARARRTRRRAAHIAGGQPAPASRSPRRSSVRRVRACS